MYESFFNLTGRPFQLNPDPRFFYQSKTHKRALAYMRYGLQQEQGFIVVTGDVGTGKTMLVNSLFRELEDQKVVAAKIVSSNVKDIDLLRLIAAEFGIVFERASKATLLVKLEEFFVACRQEGKRVLLIIDEAQNLPRSALEEMRMLSNFDRDGVPLVQSFLLGQREFRGILRAPGLEQLRQRIIAAYHLKPLSAPEVKAYIEHRIRKVGWNGDPAVEDVVYERIFQATGGVPRRINTLFDRVLLNCYLDGAHAVTLAMVNQVCNEIAGEQGDDEDDDDVTTSPTEAHAPAARTALDFDADHEIIETIELREDVPAAALKMPPRPVDIPVHALNQLSPVMVDDGPVALGSAANTKRGFPLWTSALISLLAVIAILGISFAVWMMQRQ